MYNEDDVDYVDEIEIRIEIKHPRVRRPSRKRKGATQVEEETRNVKKVKSTLPTAKTGCGFPWTAEEDAALVEAVDEHGLDWGRIKAEYGARLGE
ncbi:hypothetical protein TL16_g08000 [Triparma laevis f. inornata]|uniref:Myb-like domain-containing protein n=1 Tax=Triparma laevis f. inornata TaxID=1714386 RepID=A0A9W7EHK9_9STRA|nr:hypothetical protein TL16_g08000 [Triparma laevis f. inornata]